MSKLKMLFWAILALMAGSYVLPYNYFHMTTSRFDVGTWGGELPEAHLVTIFLGLACIPAALAVRTGRPPGTGMRILMYVGAVIGLALIALTAASYAGSTSRSAGPSFYIQSVAAIGVLVLAVMVGRMREPASGAPGTPAAQ
jgi:hypothetical protein